MVLKKIISCQVFKPYLEKIIRDPENWDITYLEISKHDEPEKLHEELQWHIDQNQNYDFIYLLYGICGNALQGLISKKAFLYCFVVHDCLAVLLSSNEKYLELHENKMGQWRCEGNYELYKHRKKQCEQEYIELYGIENARYLMELLYPQTDTISYITFDSEQDRMNLAQIYRETSVQILHGDFTLLNAMLYNQKHEMIKIQEAGRPIQIEYRIGEDCL